MPQIVKDGEKVDLPDDPKEEKAEEKAEKPDKRKPNA